MYKGAMSDGLREGLGAFFHLDGNRYEGEWQNDQAHGQGRMIYRDTSTYDGEWRLGRRHGVGLLTYASDGRVKSYKGDWVDDVEHGYGLLAWHGGESYEGEFVRGAMTGEGQYWFADGYVHQGSFVDGEPHGKGSRMTPDGIHEVGEWSRGVLVSTLAEGTVSVPANNATPASRKALAGLKSRFTILSSAQVEAAFQACDCDATQAAIVLEGARTTALVEKAKLAKQQQVAAHASWSSGEALLNASRFGGMVPRVMMSEARRAPQVLKPGRASSAAEYARLLKDPRMSKDQVTPIPVHPPPPPTQHRRRAQQALGFEPATVMQLSPTQKFGTDNVAKAKAAKSKDAQRDARRTKKKNEDAAMAREERAARRREEAAVWAKEREEAGARILDAAVQRREKQNSKRADPGLRSPYGAAEMRIDVAQSIAKLPGHTFEAETLAVIPGMDVKNVSLVGLEAGSESGAWAANARAKVDSKPLPNAQMKPRHEYSPQNREPAIARLEAGSDLLNVKLQSTSISMAPQAPHGLSAASTIEPMTSEFDNVFDSYDLPSLAELRAALAAGRDRPEVTPRAR